MAALTKAQQYVAGKHALDTLWNEMTDGEREEAQHGIDWLDVIAVGIGNGKKRGRPRGSKNKTPQAKAESDKLAEDFGI